MVVVVVDSDEPTGSSGGGLGCPLWCVTSGPYLIDIITSRLLAMIEYDW